MWINLVRDFIDFLIQIALLLPRPFPVLCRVALCYVRLQLSFLSLAACLPCVFPIGSSVRQVLQNECLQRTGIEG